MTVTSLHRPRGDAIAYEPVPHWGALPFGFSFGGDATAVAVDSNDRVYVFNRGPRSLLVFDSDGMLCGGWGDGEFENPHSIRIDAHDNLYLTETNPGHVVQKRTVDGELIFQLGKRGAPAERFSGDYFNGPTDIAVHPVTGELFVSDGYGNSRVHRFSPDGAYISSWGEPGSDPGQLYLPHSLALLDDERLVICDRENFRLQIFTIDGEFVAEWHMFHPCAVTVSPVTKLIYVGLLGPPAKYHGVPNLGNRIFVLNQDGEVVAKLGSTLPGFEPDQFLAPHSLAIDSHGDLYVAEVPRTWIGMLEQEPTKGESISLRKWHLERPV